MPSPPPSPTPGNLKATNRLSTLSSHLTLPSSSPSPSPTATPAPTRTMAAPQTPAEKPPITCHVLDTTIGRPASGISVTLRLDNPPPRSSSSSGGDVVFKGLTNTDGRVVAWDPVTSPRTDNSNNITLKEVFNTFVDKDKHGGHDDNDDGKQKYTLTFDVLPYLASSSSSKKHSSSGGGGGGDGDGDGSSIPDPFFEEVVVKFVVSQEQRERGEHFHVPLLLGGFGFTVYRGS